MQKPEVVHVGVTRCGFSQKSPNLDYLTVTFAVFEQFLAKPHLVARQIVTFWPFGKNMFGCCLFSLNSKTNGKNTYINQLFVKVLFDNAVIPQVTILFGRKKSKLKHLSTNMEKPMNLKHMMH